MGAQARMLGRRLHLQHGPIDLIIEAWGVEREVLAAYGQAREAFVPVLQTLVDELPVLRREIRHGPVEGPVAKRMVRAVSDHEGFVTPMAAVAGSVADHILGAMCTGRNLSKASVNNGGDIALFLSEEESFTIGIGDIDHKGATLSPVTLSAGDCIGGVATSGWRGRSHSLGIADFVTVFAKDAAAADVAATLIANAVDAPSSSAVTRLPAVQLSHDSDLGNRMATVDVGRLSEAETTMALASGKRCAKAMLQRGLIALAVLGLQGRRRVVGTTKLCSDTALKETSRLKKFQMMGETA